MHGLGAWVVMVRSPRTLIDSVVRSVCGTGVDRLVPLTGGGMNETYRAELINEVPVVVRISRQAEGWFRDEAHLMKLASAVGVPTAEVLGLEQVHHDGQLLSFSVQQLLPGRPLDVLAGELSAADLETLVVDAGELLARVHSVVPEPDRGIRHELRWPDERLVATVARVVEEMLGSTASEVVGRGVDFVREVIATHPAPPGSLAQGDFLPKNLLVHESAIVGVIDWEFAGPASPAFDLARWDVSAGEPLHERTDLVRRGYARVADPQSAAAGLTPAFAIDWALEMLAWQNPASPAQIRRCVEVIARYATPDQAAPWP